MKENLSTSASSQSGIEKIVTNIPARSIHPSAIGGATSGQVLLSGSDGVAEWGSVVSYSDLDAIWASRAGVIEDFMLPESAVPAGAVICAGQALTTASPLRTALIAAGNPYGVSGSDPLLPDLRGRGRAGLDNMGGSDAGRLSWANTLGTAGGVQTADHHHRHLSAIGINSVTPVGITPTDQGYYGAVATAGIVTTTARTFSGTIANATRYTVPTSTVTIDHMQPTMLLNAIAWTGLRP